MTSIPLGPGREFDAVRDFARRWGVAAQGLGSDCALMEVPAGQLLCVSTDTSVEGVHFRKHWLSAREIGYRSAAAALSDLAAAAAAPLGLLVALAVPDRWRGQLGEIADGVGEAARLAGCAIVGGDTTAAPDALALTVTVLGSAAAPLTRAGARPGDRIYVTGVLGGPRAALRALGDDHAPTPADRDRFARPVPRLVEARWLAARGARAAIDVSDGLAADLGHIAAASGVRIRVALERVPCVAGADPLDAMASGEEYELAVVMPRDVDQDAFTRATGTPLTAIGAVLEAGDEGPAVEAYQDGARVDLPRGYDHFSSP